MSTAISGIYEQISKSQYAKNSKVQNQQFTGILEGRGSEDTNRKADTQETSLYHFSVYEKGDFSIYKSENYSAENPMMYICGTDENGEPFEKSIDPREINPEDSTFIEFAAVSVWLADDGEYSGFLKDYNFADLKHIADNNISEKKDYLDILRNWRDDQVDLGNMAGYDNVVKICSAVSNLLLDRNGKTEYIEIENEMKKVYLCDAGIDSTGSLGSGGFQGVWFGTYYAVDSTAENPIVEVCIRADAWGEGKEEKYRIVINDIDPTHATQMEMFALCAHVDKQSGHDPDSIVDSNYYAGWLDGLFNAQTVDEFTSVKRDWIEEAEALAEEESGILQTGGGWIDKFLELFDAYQKEQVPEVEEEEPDMELLDRLFEDKDVVSNE